MLSIKTAQPIGNDECTLNQLVDQLIMTYQPAARKQDSYFINKVPVGLPLRINKGELVTLLGTVFHIMANCSRDTFIEVSAETYLDVIMLHIKDASTFNSYAISSKRQLLQQQAEKTGGFLTIDCDQPKETIVTYSFTNSEAVRPEKVHQMRFKFGNELAYA